LKAGPGAVLALVVALAALGLQQRRVSDPHVRYDRFSLPAFDAYVHVAMADFGLSGPRALWRLEPLPAFAASGAVAVSLGEQILRTETASVVAAALVLQHFGRLGS